MPKKISELLDHINSISTSEQFYLANKCRTSAAHIRNIAHGFASCNAQIAVALERELQGKVRVETLCPEVDWSYIRRTGRRGKSRKKP